MPEFPSEQEQHVTTVRNRFDELEATFASMMREAVNQNDMELLARIERSKKLVAEKGRAVDVLLGEAASASEQEWPRVRRSLEQAWTDYREIVDRTRLEFERASELS